MYIVRNQRPVQIEATACASVLRCYCAGREMEEPSHCQSVWELSNVFSA